MRQPRGLRFVRRSSTPSSRTRQTGQLASRPNRVRVVHSDVMQSAQKLCPHVGSIEAERMGSSKQMGQAVAMASCT